MKIVYTARSRRHLKEIRLYVAEQSYPSRAKAYVGRIMDYCEGLADFPMRGSAHDDVLPGLRMVGFERNATIAFTVGEKEVIIEGVLYGGRSVSALLDDTE